MNELTFRAMPVYSPDGWTESSIDDLLREVHDELARDAPPAPTSALLDGSAAERRERRITARRLGTTVRVLRTHTPVAVLDAAA